MIELSVYEKSLVKVCLKRYCESMTESPFKDDLLKILKKLDKE